MSEDNVKVDFSIQELIEAAEFKCVGCKRHLCKEIEAKDIIYCPHCRSPYHLDCLKDFGCQNPECSHYENRKKEA